MGVLVPLTGSTHVQSKPGLQFANCRCFPKIMRKVQSCGLGASRCNGLALSTFGRRRRMPPFLTCIRVIHGFSILKISYHGTFDNSCEESNESDALRISKFFRCCELCHRFSAGLRPLEWRRSQALAQPLMCHCVALSCFCAAFGFAPHINWKICRPVTAARDHHPMAKSGHSYSSSIA